MSPQGSDQVVSMVVVVFGHTLYDQQLSVLQAEGADLHFMSYNWELPNHLNRLTDAAGAIWHCSIRWSPGASWSNAQHWIIAQ